MSVYDLAKVDCVSGTSCALKEFIQKDKQREIVPVKSTLLSTQQAQYVTTVSNALLLK